MQYAYKFILRRWRLVKIESYLKTRLVRKRTMLTTVMLTLVAKALDELCLPAVTPFFD
jgi:hypothetical protein